jgi:anthranilate synthase component 1
MISEIEFNRLGATGYNRVPVQAQAFADLETPLSLYLKLTGHRAFSFLLESVVGGERFGRYSFIGLPARTLLRASGFGAAIRTEVVTDGVVTECSSVNPLDFIADYQKRFKVALQPACRVSVVDWRAILATTRCATSRKSWSTVARPTAWALPGHPAVAV